MDKWKWRFRYMNIVDALSQKNIEDPRTAPYTLFMARDALKKGLPLLDGEDKKKAEDALARVNNFLGKKHANKTV